MVILHFKNSCMKTWRWRLCYSHIYWSFIIADHWEVPCTGWRLTYVSLDGRSKLVVLKLQSLFSHPFHLFIFVLCCSTLCFILLSPKPLVCHLFSLVTPFIPILSHFFHLSFFIFFALIFFHLLELHHLFFHSVSFGLFLSPLAQVSEST